MGYRIARTSLIAFVEQQVTLIEATPPPPDLRAVVQADDIAEEELAGVWLGAGLATQIGLAILERPERFLELAPPAETAGRAATAPVATP